MAEKSVFIEIGEAEFNSRLIRVGTTLYLKIPADWVKECKYKKGDFLHCLVRKN